MLLFESDLVHVFRLCYEQGQKVSNVQVLCKRLSVGYNREFNLLCVLQCTKPTPREAVRA